MKTDASKNTENSKANNGKTLEEMEIPKKKQTLNNRKNSLDWKALLGEE